MDEYNVEPEDFLEQVHNLDYSIIGPDLELKNALHKINGKKIIYTNANLTHANKILKQLDIENIFDEIFDITKANYIPKPDIQPYHQLVNALNINAEKAVMFDDIAKNLVPASKIGFTTVWINTGNENYSDDIANSKKFLDYETTNLPLWLNSTIK